jgi:hypothetical protein
VIGSWFSDYECSAGLAPGLLATPTGCDSSGIRRSAPPVLPGMGGVGFALLLACSPTDAPTTLLGARSTALAGPGPTRQGGGSRSWTGVQATGHQRKYFIGVHGPRPHQAARTLAASEREQRHLEVPE